jgi:hypothetical protein
MSLNIYTGTQFIFLLYWFNDKYSSMQYQVSLSWFLVAIGELFYILTVKSGNAQPEREPSS